MSTYYGDLVVKTGFVNWPLIVSSGKAFEMNILPVVDKILFLTS